MADTEFGSPAPEDVEASETAAAIAAGVPLEDEETDQMEAAYEATQREVEQDIRGSAEGTEVTEEGETLLAGKYNSVEDLEKAYGHLESKLGELGPKAGESQELRERLARLEGQAQVTQQAPPMADPRLQTRQAFADQRQRVYEEQGFGEDQARDIASKDAVALGMFVEAEIGSHTQRYDAVLRTDEREQTLRSNAFHMRAEKANDGNPLRPEWDDVVKTQEFENAASEMGDNFYTKQGLELAYLRTLPAVQERLRTESSSAAGAARADSSAAKRRASVGPAATPASKTRSSKTSDDVEIEAIYESARAGKKSRNAFDGGAFD